MYIWAHRGASGEYPENTLLAFEQAIAQGADGIELDVFQVEDQFYIWHDRYLPASMGQDVLIYEQTKALVTSHALPQQQKIPTLAEALALIAGRVAVNVEMKYVEDVSAFLHILTNAAPNGRLETIWASSVALSTFSGYSCRLG